MYMAESQPLSIKERLTIGWGVPINAAGYSIVNKKNFINCLKFYWDHKKKKYFKITRKIRFDKNINKEIKRWMPVLCYKMMLKSALKREGKFKPKLYKKWEGKYPYSFDKTWNPKHIPRE
jgi:hypothetical protein